MFYKRYRDLDDLYFNLCKYPFNECTEDLNVNGSSWWVYGNCIEIESPNCSIDMSKINYTKSKWNTLIHKYIDLDEWKAFKEKLKVSSKKSLTFNFKKHDDKDGCLISMVLTRNNNSKPFDKLFIQYRVTEIFKKFSVDLILFNRICEELKQCNCDINLITLFLPAMFFRVEFMAELIGEYFNIEDFKEDNFTTNKLKYDYEKFYGKEASVSNYHAIKRKQELKKRKDKLKSIPIDSLRIE